MRDNSRPDSVEGREVSMGREKIRLCGLYSYFFMLRAYLTCLKPLLVFPVLSTNFQRVNVTKSEAQR